MKKVLILLIIIILLAGGGGAAYYFLVMKKQQDADTNSDTHNQPQSSLQAAETEVEEIEREKRYIVSEKADVYSGSTFDSDVVDILDLRDEIKVYATNGRWIRINVESEENAQWVYKEDISATFPTITEREKYRDTKRLIRSGDDFEANEERFVELTQQLMDTSTCSKEDIQILNGWIRSLTYADKPVYYTYCGGVAPKDKLYLNLDSGEWFRTDN